MEGKQTLEEMLPPTTSNTERCSDKADFDTLPEGRPGTMLWPATSKACRLQGLSLD